MLPVLGTSIYMSVYISQRGLTVGQGNVAVFMLGIIMIICSWRPIANILVKAIPKSTNTGIFIGVGLLCSLEVSYWKHVAVYCTLIYSCIFVVLCCV